MGIKSDIIYYLTNLFSNNIAVVLLACLPIFELRLSLPLAILKFKIAPLEAYLLSCIGNILPVIPLLYIFNYFSSLLENIPLIGKLFSLWFKRAQKRSDIVRVYGFLGLIIFVAIPLPGTGAWTGSLVASLLKMKKTYSFYAISLGVMLAGVIVLILTLTASEMVNQWIIRYNLKY